jgi:hypothetical protein
MAMYTRGGWGGAGWGARVVRVCMAVALLMVTRVAGAQRVDALVVGARIGGVELVDGGRATLRTVGAMRVKESDSVATSATVMTLEGAERRVAEGEARVIPPRGTPMACDRRKGEGYTMGAIMLGTLVAGAGWLVQVISINEGGPVSTRGPLTAGLAVAVVGIVVGAVAACQ